MGRKSALTEKQWEEIHQRMLAGDSTRSIAKDYSISEAAIRKRLGAHVHHIKTVAKQMVAAEANFKALPIGSQIKARTLADRLAAVSNHMLSAAEYGAATSHRLAGIANGLVAKIDDESPIKDETSRDYLRDILALTRTANEAAEVAIHLLKANKDKPDPEGAKITVYNSPDMD